VGRSGGEQPRVANASENDPIQLSVAISSSQNLIKPKTNSIDGSFRGVERLGLSIPVRFANYDAIHEERYAEAENMMLTQQVLLDAANATLKALSGYLLPLLYGLLGAAAYVMRTLSSATAATALLHLDLLQLGLGLGRSATIPYCAGAS
jgi:hypothetical protein